MVYIETIIQCDNCSHDYGQRGNNMSCSSIDDIILNYFNQCCKCKLDICENCSLLDTEDDWYCEDCYWKYVQEGLRTVKR